MQKNIELMQKKKNKITILSFFYFILLDHHIVKPMETNKIFV